MNKKRKILSLSGIILAALAIVISSVLQLTSQSETASAKVTGIVPLQKYEDISNRITTHCLNPDGVIPPNVAEYVRPAGLPVEIRTGENVNHNSLVQTYGVPLFERNEENCRAYGNAAADFYINKYNSCVSTSGASTVDDIQTKCNICVYRETSRDGDLAEEVEKWYGYYAGTGWLGSADDPSKPEIDMSGAVNGKVKAALFSRQYSCANPHGGVSLNQFYTWFGARDNYGDPSTGLMANPLNWITIEPNTPYNNIGIYIGTMPNRAWAWSTDAFGANRPSAIPVTIDIYGFYKYASDQGVDCSSGTCEVEITTNSCATQTHDGKYHWGETLSKDGIPMQCGGNPTILKIINGDSDPCDPDHEDCGGGGEDPCDPSEEICSGGGDASFTSTTTVHVDVSEDAHESYYDSATGTWKNVLVDPNKPDDINNWKPLEVTSPVEGNAAIKFSTDSYDTVVKFWHTLDYTGYNEDSEATSVADKSTSWTSNCTMPEGVVGACIPDKKNGSWTGVGLGGSNSGVKKVDGTNTAVGMTENIGYYEKHVYLNPGESATVCRRIDYSPKEVTYKNETYSCGEHGEDTCEYDHRYVVEKTGMAGSSYACAYVYRPAEPDDDGPWSTSTADSTLMFAGETATIGWTAGASSIPTRRLSAWQALVYRVAPQIQYDNIDTSGTFYDERFRGIDACAYYENSSVSGMSIVKDSCRAMAGAYKKYNTSTRQYELANNINYHINIQNPEKHFAYATKRYHDYEQELEVAVPNQVGSKYCNSFAYKYEFWYAYIKSGETYNTDPSDSEDDLDDPVSEDEGEDDDHDGEPWDDGSDNPLDPGDWHKIPGRDYWNIYDSACRTIAKKPTAATWNGSLLTTGGIKTSKAYRYESDELMGKKAETMNRRVNRNLYSSWVEFLGIANNNISIKNAAGFATGAATATGSGRNSNSICATELPSTNSPLTVANTGCTNSDITSVLGYSGILNNTTYQVRLRTYLENHADRELNDADLITINTNGTDKTCYSLNNINTTSMNGTTIIKVPGNLCITKNITTNSNQTYSSIYDIPQVVLFVKGDVEISSEATQIDAWIVADGSVNSCYEFIAGNTGSGTRGTESDTNNSYMSNICTKQLVFNAPVMATNLNLRRSYGSDIVTTNRLGTFSSLNSVGSSTAQRYNAAEVFNLRADVYLWAYAQAGRYDSSYTESYSRELAPRY